MATIRTPRIATATQNLTGTVAGVEFVDGIGETTDPAALRYFYVHGYDISSTGEFAVEATADPPGWIPVGWIPGFSMSPDNALREQERRRVAGLPQPESVWEHGRQVQQPIKVGGALQDAAEDPEWEAPPPS